MKEGSPKPVVDAIILQVNGGFKGFIHEQNMWNIAQVGGLTKYSEVALLDTEERPVDNGVKDGSNPIFDVLVPHKVLQPNIQVYLS